MGCAFGIPDAVMGLTFLAAGTSVPDLLTSVIVAKQGACLCAYVSPVPVSVPLFFLPVCLRSVSGLDSVPFFCAQARATWQCPPQLAPTSLTCSSAFRSRGWSTAFTRSLSLPLSLSLALSLSFSLSLSCVCTRASARARACVRARVCGARACACVFVCLFD